MYTRSVFNSDQEGNSYCLEQDNTQTTYATLYNKPNNKKPGP